MEKRKAIEVVAAVIRRGERFLACQRPEGKARALLWEFPGGKVEPGETPKQAIVRELQEELGVTVEPKGICTEVIHDYPELTVHLTLFHAVLPQGEPQRLEHNDLRWVTPQEAEELDFCPADRPFVALLQQKSEE